MYNRIYSWICHDALSTFLWRSSRIPPRRWCILSLFEFITVITSDACTRRTWERHILSICQYILCFRVSLLLPFHESESRWYIFHDINRNFTSSLQNSEHNCLFHQHLCSFSLSSSSEIRFICLYLALSTSSTRQLRRITPRRISNPFSVVDSSTLADYLLSLRLFKLKQLNKK